MTTSKTSQQSAQDFIDFVGGKLSSGIEAYKGVSRRSAVMRVFNGVVAVLLSYLIILPILAVTFGSEVWAGAVEPAVWSIVAIVLFLGAFEGLGAWAARIKKREHANGCHVSPF